MTDSITCAPVRLPELSLRDYFAAQAIGAAAELCRDDGAFPSDENIATAAYGIADALLRARGNLDAGPVPAHRIPCLTCNGTGTALVETGDGVEPDTCPDCGGDGWETEALDPEEVRRLAEEGRYALNKQLATAHTLESTYGGLALDDELRQAIIEAVTPILKRRIRAGEEV